MSDPLIEALFWNQVLTDAKRTIFCSPDLESRCKDWAEARGLSGLITVKASHGVPDDRVFIIDEGAIRAGLNQRMVKPIIQTWPSRDQPPEG